MEETKNILKKLAVIQKELKAPKGQFNKFGNYKYRSAEDILEAVKPLLDKTKTVLILNDDIKTRDASMGDSFGSWVYVETTAILFCTESGEQIFTKAFARESEVKKGMDSSQITGSVSSYARKYALNGLFAIDDTKDADTDEYAKNTTQKETKKAPVKKTLPKATDSQIKKIKELYKNEELAKILSVKEDKVDETLPKLNVEQVGTLIEKKNKENEEKAKGKEEKK